MTTQCSKTLAFCAAHRLLGQGGKCEHLHGHNYRVDVTAEGSVDTVGQVIDFSEIKRVLGHWIDENWDHGIIYNRADGEMLRIISILDGLLPGGQKQKAYAMASNPTAENMAEFLLDLSRELGLTSVVAVSVWETDTCYATAQRE